jgi:hypothetical protein
MRSRWALLIVLMYMAGFSGAATAHYLGVLDFSVEVAEETNPLGTMIAKLSPGPGS